MSSGVHGVALPFNYVNLDGELQQVTVGMKVSGADRVQQLMVDTGSSTIMFCNESIAANDENAKTDYVQCLIYSFPEQCPNGDVGYPIFWTGPVYQGDVTAYDALTGEQEIAVMKDVPYAISEQKNIYACTAPMDGIIGVSYSKGNNATVLPDRGAAAPELLDVLCYDDDGTSAITKCNFGNLSTTILNSPIEQVLREGVESGYNLVEAFGMHVNYDATKDADVNTVVPGLGIYYGGNMALNNPYYNGGTPQVRPGRVAYVVAFDWLFVCAYLTKSLFPIKFHDRSQNLLRMIPSITM